MGKALALVEFYDLMHSLILFSKKLFLPIYTGTVGFIIFQVHLDVKMEG